MISLAFNKHRVQKVRISVISDNTPALLLYSSLGFFPYSIEELRDPRGVRVALIHRPWTGRIREDDRQIFSHARAIRCQPSSERRSKRRNIMAAYRERPAYQQNDYLGWTEPAKRQETKEKRLNQMLGELEAGVSIYGYGPSASRKD